MKNGILVSIVLVAVVAAFVILSSRKSEKELISMGPGGVVDTDELAEAMAEHRKESEAEAVEQRPVPSATGPWPKAIAEETTYDFDKMQVGAELEHIFVIRNDGDAVLNLLEGKSTCKCTGFTLSQKQLQKGEETELKIRWIGKFRDESFQHGGPVYTDDPERPQVNFAVKGKVDNAVEILPADVWSVGQMIDGQPGSMKAHLVSKIYDDIEVISVKSLSEFVTVDVSALSKEMMAERQIEAVSGLVLSVKVSSQIPAGPFKATVELQTNRVEEPLTVNVTATMAGPIEIQQSPGVIWLPSVSGLKIGQFSATKGRQVELTLVVNEEKLDGDLTLKNVSAIPTYITAALTPMQKLDNGRGRYKLKLSIPPGTPKATFDRHRPAKLVLETNHPANPKLSINISFKAF